MPSYVQRRLWRCPCCLLRNRRDRSEARALLLLEERKGCDRYERGCPGGRCAGKASHRILEREGGNYKIRASEAVCKAQAKSPSEDQGEKGKLEGFWTSLALRFERTFLFVDRLLVVGCFFLLIFCCFLEMSPVVPDVGIFFDNTSPDFSYFLHYFIFFHGAILSYNRFSGVTINGVNFPSS